MKIIKSSKILALSSFFIILILAFVLFGKLTSINEAIETDLSLDRAYLFISVIVILSLINLGLVMRLTAKSKTKEDYLKKTTDSHMDEIGEDEASTSSDQANEEQQIDIEETAKKIIPSNDKNMDTGQLTEKMLINIASAFDIVQGLFYIRKNNADTFTIAGKFAYYGEEEPKDFELGVALTGQTAKNQKVLNLAKMPENYFTVLSGLGNSSPNSLMIVPVIHNQKTIGVIEMASFKYFDKKSEHIFTQLSEKIGERLSETI
ncbi:MAG: GAF domain-containing protein [Bacteroidales bacterium]|nr:GAF domain-containing protein [Bacteroidales bacterium]